MSTFTQHDVNLPQTLDEVMASPNIWFTLTNRCNLNCQYCFNYCAKKHEDMPAELATAILDYCISYRKKLKLNYPYLRLIFFGGEPTLNPKAIRAIVDYVNQNRINCLLRLITNGVIDDDFLEWLIAERVFLQVSFDGFTGNLRGICGQNNYQKQVLKTITRLEQNSSFPYSLHATIHAGNVDSMSQIVEFAAAHRADAVAFCPVCLEGNAIRYNVKRPTITSYIDNYFKALKTAEKHNLRLHSVEKQMQCRELVGKSLPLVWLPDGHLALCDKYASSAQTGANAAIIGKYSFSTQDFFLDEAILAKIRSNFFAKRSKYCDSCNNYENCKGLNSFVAYSLNQHSNDKFMCEATRKIVEKLNQIAA